MRVDRSAALGVAALAAGLAGIVAFGGRSAAAGWPPSLVACACEHALCLEEGADGSNRLAVVARDGSVVVATWRDGHLDWGADRHDTARFATVASHRVGIVVCPPGIMTPEDPHCRRSAGGREGEISWRGWWLPAGERLRLASCPSIGTIRGALVDADVVLLPVSDPGRDGAGCATERRDVQIAPPPR